MVRFRASRDTAGLCGAGGEGTCERQGSQYILGSRAMLSILGREAIKRTICHILFYSILFYSILFYSIHVLVA